jgi:protein TonB
MKRLYAKLVFLCLALCFQVCLETTLAAESTDVSPVKILYQPDVQAYYPSFSQRKGEKGLVEVRLIIGEDGQVTSVSILKSSSYFRLDDAAQVIGMRYRFSPLLINGKPTSWATDLSIRFGIKAEDS